MQAANVSVCAQTGGLIGLSKEGRARLSRILDECTEREQLGTYGVGDHAAHLLRRIGQDQPFVDGNKRTAFAVAAALAAQNGSLLLATNEQLLEFLPRLKEGWISPADLIDWVEKHTQKA